MASGARYFLVDFLGDFRGRFWWKILGESFCEILRVDFFLWIFCEILAGVLGAKKFFNGGFKPEKCA